jgi:hypothetical protein
MSQSDPKVDACKYLMVLLLQELEEERPGTIDEMTKRIKADWHNSSPPTQQETYINEIFVETLEILKQAEAPLKYKDGSEELDL